MHRKKVGLVLSGGGVKGMAHIGVIKALNERGIHPSIISGASAGALVGCLYAGGVSIEDMLKFFKETPLFKYNYFAIDKPGLFNTSKYRSFFENYISATTFDQLKKELTVVATNLQKGESHFFNTGQLFYPILASAALPPVFSPVEINKELYADGAIMNNFPVEPLTESCDFIIGSYTSSMKVLQKNKISNALQLTQRANTLMLHANSNYKFSIPDILVVPKDLGEIGVLDKKGIEKAFDLGYYHACKVLDKKETNKALQLI